MYYYCCCDGCCRFCYVMWIKYDVGRVRCLSYAENGCSWRERVKVRARNSIIRTRSKRVSWQRARVVNNRTVELSAESFVRADGRQRVVGRWRLKAKRLPSAEPFCGRSRRATTAESPNIGIVKKTVRFPAGIADQTCRTVFFRSIRYRTGDRRIRPITAWAGSGEIDDTRSGNRDLQTRRKSSACESTDDFRRRRRRRKLFPFRLSRTCRRNGTNRSGIQRKNFFEFEFSSAPMHRAVFANTVEV